MFIYYVQQPIAMILPRK